MYLQEVLEEYGLSDREAKIYLAAINLGTSPIAQLAKKSGMKRPTAYPVIDDLLERHLLIMVPKGKKKYYKAENPKELIHRLDMQKNKLASALPQLEAIYLRNLKQPKVRFYEGHNQLLKMYEEVFREKEVWTITSDEYFEVFSDSERRHFFRILIRQGGILYDLLEDTKRSREGVKAKYRTGVCEVKFLPDDMTMETDIYVFGNKVAQVSLENMLGVIIEDNAISKTQKSLMQFIWNKL